MPFGTRTLNDGRKIPEIGFGTWKIPQDVCKDQVNQSVEIGFDHIDTAQAYQNEEETGQAIAALGMKREQLWVTTKFSGRLGTGPSAVRKSCLESLQKLGLDYVDLYLVHSPRLCDGDIRGTWKEMEKLKKEGLVKSIGVSNFKIHDLKVLLKHADIKPVVNQILYHPYVAASTQPLIDFQDDHDILFEGYSSLIPLTGKPGGPVDKPVQAISERIGLAPEQVLLAWSRAKGAILVTTSSRSDRLTRYLAVGDVQLTDEDIHAIDKAGKKGEENEKVWQWVKTAGKVGLLGGMGVYALAKYVL